MLSEQFLSTNRPGELMTNHTQFSGNVKFDHETGLQIFYQINDGSPQG